MENEYRVKRDSFEIYFAVHDDQDWNKQKKIRPLLLFFLFFILQNQE